jgi:predicted metal-dependent enzyme (double-stranded beta helix superfamily)
MPGRGQFDVDRFVEDCRRASFSGSPATAVAELLAIVARDRKGIEPQLGTRVGSDFGLVHASPELVVQRAIFPLSYSTGLHEHRLWAFSAVYAGCEQHDLHRVEGDRLRPIGVRTTTAGEVHVIEPDVAHSSTAVGDEHLGVLHVYLGDLFSSGAGEWDTPEGDRREYSDAWMDRLISSLAEADLIAD